MNKANLIVMTMLFSIVSAMPQKRAASTTTTKKSTTTTKKTSTTKKSTTTTKKPTTTTINNNTTTIKATDLIVSTPFTTNSMTPTPTFVSDPLNSSSQSNTGAIVGGIIAGIAVLIMGITACLVMKRRKRNTATTATTTTKKVDPFTIGYSNQNPPPKQTSTFDNYEISPISQNQTVQYNKNYYTVIATFTPTLSDELDIAVGDEIELLIEYDDGWCQGYNITKGRKGAFPRHCIDLPNHNFHFSNNRVSSMMYK